MKKIKIGLVINREKITREEKYFFEVARKLNIDLVVFNVARELDEIKEAEKAKKCKIIYNDSGDYLSIEFSKTLEEMGCKVVEPSEISYYMEDKWLMYLKFKKNKIPLPETILLSTNLASARKELKDFDHWPIVLKRIYGERGDFVEKANNIDQAMETIKYLWKKGNQRLPIIAQEFISSDSFRVTMINGKIVQTAVKKRHGWKATGCNDFRFRKFKVDSELRRISHEIAEMSNIEVLGIDFAKHNGKWLVIEVNAEPSLKMFDTEHKEMVKKVLLCLRNLAEKKPSRKKS